MSTEQFDDVIPTEQIMHEITRMVRDFCIGYMRDEIRRLSEVVSNGGIDNYEVRDSFSKAVAAFDERGEYPRTDITIEQISRGTRSESVTGYHTGYTDQSFDRLTPMPDAFRVNIRCQYPDLNITYRAPGSVSATARMLGLGDYGAWTEDALLDALKPILERSPYVRPPRPFKVFIGHGNDLQWRALEAELREQFGFDITSFEVEPRAGQTINMVLEKVAREASVAILVMTKADKMESGVMRARQNVVHEIGYFQGRLGWTNAIVVNERGVDLFTNLDGTQRVEFPDGEISAATGKVAATLNARKIEAGYEL